VLAYNTINAVTIGKKRREFREKHPELLQTRNAVYRKNQSGQNKKTPINARIQREESLALNALSLFEEQCQGEFHHRAG
jgi:hypothetical protein